MKQSFLLWTVIFCVQMSQAQQPAFNQNSSRSNHTRAFNQNSSRSNHTRAYNQNAARSNTARMSFGAGSGYASPVQRNNDSSLYTQGGAGFQFQAEYLIGRFGLGLSSGFFRNGFNDGRLNDYLRTNNFPTDRLVVTSSGSQSSFIFLGPVMRMGQQFMVDLYARAGLVLQSPSSFTIQQQGAIRPAIRTEPIGKTQFGWNAGAAFHYQLGHGISAGVFSDLMQFRSDVNRYDIRVREGLTPTLISQTISNLSAGVSVRYSIDRRKQKSWSTNNFRSAPGSDPGDGVDSAVESPQTRAAQHNTTRSNRGDNAVAPPADNGPLGDEPGILDPASGRVLKTKTRSNQSNDRAASGCGPVTQKTTYADGTVEEMTFSCPQDALQYESRKKQDAVPARISTNLAERKSPENAAGGVHLLAGRIYLVRDEGGIVTNRSQSQFSASGMHTNPGVQAHFYTRPSGGEARSSGAAQPYQPFYREGQPQAEVCDSCPATISNPLYEEKGSGVKNNPLYKGKGSGANPLSARRERGNREECDDGNAVFDVQLLNRETGAVMAVTQTDACGEYWFANVPAGRYSVAVTRFWLSKKSYDMYSASAMGRTDVAGQLLAPAATWEHIIYDTKGGKVSLKDFSVVAGDVDGDGEAEIFRVQGGFSDGSTRDLTSDAMAARKGGGGKASMQDFHLRVASAGTGAGTGGQGKVSLQDFHFTKKSDKSGFRALATFSDGSEQDITELTDLREQAGVIQVYVQTADTDGDGQADLVWSPRSNLGVNAQSARVNLKELTVTKKTDAIRQRLNVATGDLDGDGEAEFLIGNGFADESGAVAWQDGQNPKQTPKSPTWQHPGTVTITARTQGGGLPPAEPGTIEAARPGNPIKGIIVKGGRNPGGDIIVNSRTNSQGEFEFPGLEPGNYRFTAEVSFMLHDVADIDLFDPPPANIVTSESNLGEVEQKKTRSARPVPTRPQGRQ